MDIEMFIPIDKQISNFNGNEDFDFINELTIDSALKLDFVGSQQELQFSAQRIVNYIKDNQVPPKSPLYTATLIDQEAIDSIGRGL